MNNHLDPHKNEFVKYFRARYHVDIYMNFRSNQTSRTQAFEIERKVLPTHDTPHRFHIFRSSA